MSIAWRDGNGIPQNTLSFALPADIEAGDLVLVAMWQQVFSGDTYPSGSFASSGTAPSQVGADHQWSDGSSLYTDQLWTVTAASGDAGATWTYTQGVGAYSACCYAAWSGTDGIDVSAYGNVTAGTTWTAPEVTTTADGDWWAEILRHAWDTSTYPGTLRYDYDSGNGALAVADSDGGVGPAGTVVGGDAWTFTGGGDDSGWTIAIKAASAPPSPSGTGLLMAGDYDHPASLVRKRFLW